jgi:hypothetical protein
MADNLTTFMCRLSRNLGDSTSWNPKGLSRPVTQVTLSETAVSVCQSLDRSCTWRPHDAAHSVHPAVSVPLLFTALHTPTRCDNRHNLTLNKYFLLNQFPRKVVNSVYFRHTSDRSAAQFLPQAHRKHKSNT